MKTFQQYIKESGPMDTWPPANWPDKDTALDAASQYRFDKKFDKNILSSHTAQTKAQQAATKHGLDVKIAKGVWDEGFQDGWMWAQYGVLD